jgi:MoaA/NifB/PqqE/SkfB family radical SAM enzyme
MLKLNDYMNKGIRDIADIAGRYYLGNRQGQLFVLDLISNLRKSTKLRGRYENKGVHVPPFLIASITASCNLKCAGCYARANDTCGSDHEIPAEMTLKDWCGIFNEASDLGISFILLAGGEPLLRRDVIKTAASFHNLVFPVFTNGTMIDEEYIAIFNENRNLIPVLSMEGNVERTDTRRGSGVSEKIQYAADAFHLKGILYGVSITVTNENMNDVTTNDFLGDLRNRGCGLVFFIEYVPAEDGTEHLTLSDENLTELQSRINLLRRDRKNKGMILLSFPGDESEMGGCLAAGRGFFHINPNGGAEPCPFSPFSEINLKEQSLEKVLQSQFFERVRVVSTSESGDHQGGCTLFQHREKVESYLNEGKHD